ncbi:MAG: isoprenyl transferase [Oscillospiraceae bacterium]|jgi:undecaprenyl diphosphate synthase|nr:isoprenyl transferase [Oscillospiraceae bacterium]
MRLAFWKKSDHTAGQVDFGRLPRHIAIILDGNGRWARRRGLPRTAGHKVGAETFRTIATYCRDIGIDYLTVYAFSTENWKRPQDEVDTIMTLLKRYLLEAIETMERDNVRLNFMGDLTVLSRELQELAAQCNAISARLTGCQCNICINYGGRAEIVHAARRFAEDCAAGIAKPEELTEEHFDGYLYSAGIPSPELLIRPGGEQRLSNFLLWQCAYTEFYSTEVLWPDFSKEDLHRAIAAYQGRDRRFGGVR